jgi:hypothetical protein
MRQQLDELDHLLQRMLSLPVYRLDDAAEVILPAPQSATAEKVASRPTPSASERVSKAAYPLLPEMPEEKTPTHVENPPAPKVRMEPSAKLRGPFVVYQPMNAPDMLMVSPPVEAKQSQPVAAAPAPAETKNWGPVGETLPPARESAPEPEPVESLPPLPEARSPFLERHQARLRKQRQTVAPLRPIGWLNSFVDRLAVALGGPFLWLIRPELRTFLGWVGIALLAASLVIVAGDWLGWSWPS